MSLSFSWTNKSPNSSSSLIGRTKTAGLGRNCAVRRWRTRPTTAAWRSDSTSTPTTRSHWQFATHSASSRSTGKENESKCESHSTATWFRRSRPRTQTGHERTAYLVDSGSYLTTLARHKLSGQLNYNDRHLVDKWFQTVSMCIDRFTPSGGGVQPAYPLAQALQTLLNHRRPNQ